MMDGARVIGLQYLVGSKVEAGEKVVDDRGGRRRVHQGCSHKGTRNRELHN